VAGLDPAPARAAAADLDLVAGHQRSGGRQVLDVLDRHPLKHQLPAAARAACRQPDRHDLVDPLGWAPVGAATVGRTRLAASTLGSGHRVVPGERGRLAPGRPAQHLTSPRSRSLTSRSRSRSARRRSFSPRSRSRSASSRARSDSSRCCSSRSAAFSSSSRARRPRNPPVPAGSRPAHAPVATLDIRREGYTDNGNALAASKPAGSAVTTRVSPAPPAAMLVGGIRVR
jgi:hypothetical protein